MTTIDRKIADDDPRLTAYALGELDEAERDAFEQALANDPEARAEVEAIRSFGGELGHELQKVAPPALTEAQRAEIAAACAPVIPLRRAPWFLRPLSLAAAALLGATGLAIFVQLDGEYESIVFRGRDKVAFGDGPVASLDQGRALLRAWGRENEEIRYDHFVTRSLEASDDLCALLERDLRNTSRTIDMEFEEGVHDQGLRLRGAFPFGDDATSKLDALVLTTRGTTVTADGPQTDPTFVRLNALTGPSESGEALETAGADAGRYTPYVRSVTHNAFTAAAVEALSTFSVDVDTASYSTVRRHLQQQYALPPADQVRIEELVNYFPYDDAGPTDEHPFATHLEVAGCPWNAKNRLVRVAIKGRELAAEKRPATNLVFLLDVSGSMDAENRLPLVKRSLELLVKQLRPEDRVSIVVYAGASGLVLEPTPGDRKDRIRAALERLSASGSTNGGAGIQLAYDVAARHFIEGGVNRVVLCTDGDWNVGPTSQEELQALIERKAKGNVFLTVLGFGMGSKDATLELLADKGNGNYGYVDTLAEARKLLVDQLAGTLVTIAKDVKVQVDWNPAAVKSYRLIGYENRVLAAKDFADDTKDAGEIGAGHSVTALYEVEPCDATTTGPLATLRLRYKLPEGDASKLLERPLAESSRSFDAASTDFRFAASVAAFGMVLRDSPHKGQSSLAMVEELASSSRGADPHGHRAEFIDLVKQARKVAGR